MSAAYEADREYVAQGFHFSTTRVEFDFKRSAEFDDLLSVTTWLDWIRGASLAMAYEVRRAEDLLGMGVTEHALVDTQGRPNRIPAERREHLRRLAVSDARKPRGKAGR